MGWKRDLRLRDIPFSVLSEFGGRYLCFDINTPAVKEFLTSASNEEVKILLSTIIADFDEMFEVFDFECWFWDVRNPPDNWEEELLRIRASKYASDSLRRSIDDKLEELQSAKRKRVEQDVKKKLVAKRRKEFQSNRDYLLLALIERDGWVCNHPDCDSQEDLTIDHVIPLSKGGTDELGNLQLLCRYHNSLKNDKLPSECA